MNHWVTSAKASQRHSTAAAASLRRLATFKSGYVCSRREELISQELVHPSPTEFGSKRAFTLQSIAGEKNCAWKLRSGETVETRATDFGGRRAFALQSIAGEKSCAWKLRSGETLPETTDFGSSRAFALQSIAGEKSCAWKLRSGETLPETTDFGSSRAFALQSIAGEKSCAWQLKSGEAVETRTTSLGSDVETSKTTSASLGFLKMAFLEFDLDKDGVLSKNELRAGLANINVPEREADTIFAGIDLDDDGSIQFEEWVNSIPMAVRQNLHEHAKEEYWRRLLLGGLRTDCDEHWGKLVFGGLESPERSKVWQQADDFDVQPSEPIGISNKMDLSFLSMAFSEFDLDNDKLLSKEELRAALTSIKITEAEADRIFACIDLNHDGKIQFNEWIDSIPTDIKDQLHHHAKKEYFSRLLWGGLRTDCDEHWNKLVFGGLDKSAQ